MGIVVSIRVEDDAVRRGLAEQRRAIGQDVKRFALSSATRNVVPAARRKAPGQRWDRYIEARSTTRGAYLTLSGSLRGERRSIVALLEFGGVVRGKIVPVKGRALKIGDRYVARVTTPRRYRPREFMQGAVRENIGPFSADLERELLRVMRSRIEYARNF